MKEKEEKIENNTKKITFFKKNKWNSRENLGSMTLESCLIYWILL